MSPLTKKALRYTLTPQIVPRMGRLFGSGFTLIAFYIAQVFAAVGLLSSYHPYLNPSNIGRFSIKHVLFESWRNLRFGWRHLDQMVMFALISIGLMLLAAQVVLFIAGFVMTTPAFAWSLSLPAYFSTMFETASPTNDIAFVMLDRVFGVPGLYGSCVDQGVACFNMAPYNPQGIIIDPVSPSPFHLGLHKMLEVYSHGLIIVGLIILAYFVITIVGETAQSGTPFGKRFNHVWAPLRLVVAFGMLIPFGTGLNSAQYIVLYAAKWGSGFATNGWNEFLSGAGIAMGDTILGNPTSLIGTPNTPSLNSIMEFSTSLAACLRVQRYHHNRTIKLFMINPKGMSAATTRQEIPPAGPFPTYDDMLDFSDYGDIYFVFGEYKEDASGTPIYSAYPGAVRPYCGELVLQITDVADAHSPGSRQILSLYGILVLDFIWQDVNSDTGTWITPAFGEIGDRAVRKHSPKHPNHDATILVIATEEELANIRIGYEAFVEAAIAAGVAAQSSAPSWTQMDDFGWAGAGIWYNKIAELNGTILSAANSLPYVRKFPELMEDVKKSREKFDQDMKSQQRFLPRRAGGESMDFGDEEQAKEAEILYAAFSVWEDSQSHEKPSGNAFYDIVHLIFGTKGLYNMSKNADIHPLAQLVGVGRSLLESSIRNLGASAFGGFAGGLANLMSLHGLSKFAGLASSVASKIGFAGITAGFMLFYLVPLMPFIYFFFAVGVWVKTIMEAMVGVPLWALAHLRIDGNGLPGSAAMTGYYLVFEVFLRPICIVFGLLASITIFGAQVRTLHEVWPLVTSNMTGFDSDPLAPPAPDELGGVDWFRGQIDQFIFTVMYTFVVYMMAMASFKLVDLLPDYILRWMGANATTFGDLYKDNVEQLPTRAVMGIGGGVGSMMGAGGKAKEAAIHLGNAMKAKE